MTDVEQLVGKLSSRSDSERLRGAWLVAGLAVMSAFACGRTQVLRYTVVQDASVDAGRDAGPDAGADAGRDAGPPDAACEPRNIQLVPAVPTVMFVLDRSGSMEEDLDGRLDAGPSRWAVLETSLRRTLPQQDSRVALGALMYPTANSDSCDVPGAVDLSPALGNANAIFRLFATLPKGGTPTWAAVGVAANHLASIHTASSARALVVATDGAPNCNLSLNVFTCVCTRAPFGMPPQCDTEGNCLDDLRTVAELNNLFQGSHLPTYVVGLGSQLNQFAATLDQMAVAGGVPRMGTGHRYYSADNQTELTDAFTRITAQLSRCTYLTNTTIGPNDHFKVLVGPDAVPPGPDGWEWLNQTNGELTLHGMACDLAAGGATASALVECQ